ncbi:hypothetical protein HYH02_009767 [Chlamydomonas schloesseri]|uniref:Major facilitator superfamily (MFS) profile domain-containing protein n=1 Tax=Chlamydomonas schloesseri TaxID=2026947 RepID=A0A835W8S5_9CHLO|nr:hypothetical protein HYH02_009767 [Chlamydomonas schloesseri]|eukprot:KAG2441973.1 hypothetical protein HYH02_009767 [Chlamydomonas schloesseri]
MFEPVSISPSITSASVYRKVSWAILPLFCLISGACYIDRTNLAFASIQLNRDLGFNAQVYGLGSGMFFLGYSLFMIPSNALVTRLGAPRLLGILVTTWGCVAASFTSLTSARQFYWLRFLLGAAEAGAFPGMWYYLYLFFPADQMTVPLSVMEAAVAVANVLSAPLAAALLALGGAGGLAGWQWLFLLEGLATVALGVVTASCLPPSLSAAAFLTGHERHWLMQRVEASGGGGSVVGGSSSGALLAGVGVGVGERGGGSSSSCSGACSSCCGGRSPLMEALTNGRVWYVAAMGLLKNMASHGILFWAPIITKALLEHRDMDPVQLDWSRHRGGDAVAAAGQPVGLGAAGELDDDDPLEGGAGAGQAGGGAGLGAGAAAAHINTAAVLLTGIPFACAAAMSIWLGRRSQAKHERSLHLAVPYLGAGLLLASLPRLAAASPPLALAAVSVAVACVQGTNSIINSYVPLVCPPGSASVPLAMAAYNAVANLGGMAGPWLVGELVWRGGGYGDAFRVLGAVMGAAAVMAWRTRKWPRVNGPSSGSGGGAGGYEGGGGPLGSKGSLELEEAVSF